MESIIISIKPKWCECIANGDKTIEIRKTKPKLQTPFKCYIYCSKGNIDAAPKKIWWKKDSTGFNHILNGKVIGEFVCNKIDCFTAEFTKTCYEDIRLNFYNEDIEEDEQKFITGNEFNNPSNCWLCDKSKVQYDEIRKYIFNGKDGFYNFYGWHISDLKIYDEPKGLSEFNLKRPPQNWCYVEEL